MIKASVAIKGLQKKVKRAAKQMEYANAVALTKTAWDVKRAEDKALDKYLHRPTPFTKKAYLVERATKKKPYSRVFAKKIQGKYLSAQVYGGQRRAEKGAIPVPATNKIKNQHGNIPRGMTKQMKADKARYFSGTPKGWGRAKSGVWRRLGTSKKAGGYRLEQLVVWETKAISYGKRLPFHRVARVEAHKKYNPHLKREFKKAMRTAR